MRDVENPTHLRREAFLMTRPKLCIRCRRGVSYKDVDLHKKSVGTLHCDIALCTQSSCGAVYAQEPPALRREDLTGYFYGRTEVIFVETLPYHIALGGSVSEALARDVYEST